uniref:Uncharacterized protein n=1 Tax=Mustela putorius furo TaxID=9669 RepID=M3YI78_MUSPF
GFIGDAILTSREGTGISQQTGRILGTPPAKQTAKLEKVQRNRGYPCGYPLAARLARESAPSRARGGSGPDTPRLVAGTNRSRAPPSGGWENRDVTHLGRGLGASDPAQVGGPQSARKG